MPEKKINVVDETLKLPKLDAFEEKVNELLSAEDAESGDPIVIAVLDVDSFDPVNKNFGHEFGDKVLIETGEYIRSKLPAEATLYRIAGDEFGIIFYGSMEKEEVFLFMEDVRKNMPVKSGDGEPITISIGVAAAYDDASRLQELMRKAENAMVRAKLSGHNKVCLAKEDKMVPKTSHYTAEQLKILTKISKQEGVGEAILLREALDMLIRKYNL